MAGDGATEGTNTYDATGATATMSSKWGGGGITFWLNSDKAECNLEAYKQIEIEVSAKTASVPLSFRLITEAEGGYFHYTPLTDMIKWDMDGNTPAGVTSSVAGEKTKITLDLSKVSNENAKKAAYTIGVQYTGTKDANGKETTAEITISSIKLIAND